MASAGWGDATTNQKWAEMMGYLWGKMAHRAMTIGEDAAASFVPTDFGAKIEITNFVVGMWPPIDDCTQQPTKFTLDRWGGDRRGRATIGERRGVVFYRSGGGRGWRGDKNKIK